MRLKLEYPEGIKACPFCGSLDVEVQRYDFNDPKWYYVNCNSCQCAGPTDLGESGAVERWNTRTCDGLDTDYADEYRNKL